MKRTAASEKKRVNANAWPTTAGDGHRSGARIGAGLRTGLSIATASLPSPDRS